MSVWYDFVDNYLFLMSRGERPGHYFYQCGENINQFGELFKDELENYVYIGRI